MGKLNWKKLNEFVDWCRDNPNEGKTVGEIGKQYVGIDLSKIKSTLARRYFADTIKRRVASLKKRVHPKNKLHFISAKFIKRNGVEITGYGSLVPTGHESLYITTTSRIVKGIAMNRKKLADNKRRLR